MKAANSSVAGLEFGPSIRLANTKLKRDDRQVEKNTATLDIFYGIRQNQASVNDGALQGSQGGDNSDSRRTGSVRDKYKTLEGGERPRLFTHSDKDEMLLQED